MWTCTGRRTETERGISTQSDSIGPLDVSLHQNLSVDSVHAGLLNLGWLPPVRPVQEPGVNTHILTLETCMIALTPRWVFYSPRQWIHSNGSGFNQALVEQNFLFGSIKIADRNGFGPQVGPVKVPVNPVYCNSHRSLDVFYHRLVRLNISTFI